MLEEFCEDDSRCKRRYEYVRVEDNFHDTLSKTSWSV